MKTSYSGLINIAREEACVLVPYPDGKREVVAADGSISYVIKYSQGYGHSDEALTPDSPAITVEQALDQFLRDLTPREKSVGIMLKGLPVTPAQFDVLVSVYFNKGNKVRKVIDYLIKADVPEAMAALLAINRTDEGLFSAGLAGRRYREMQIFLKGDYGFNLINGQPIGRDGPVMIKLWRGDPKLTPAEMIPFPPSKGD